MNPRPHAPPGAAAPLPAAHPPTPEAAQEPRGPRWRLRLPSLALVGRELIEISGRRRTYVARSLICLLGLAVFGIATPASLGQDSMIGHGDLVVACVEVIMGSCVLLMLPVMGALSIGQERAQGTLVLLLLTPIRPLRLVLQKWLAISMSMVSLLLTLMPFLAIGYACGGVSDDEISMIPIGLVLLIGQVAALGLAVSSWTRSGIGACILTYVSLAVLSLLMPLISSHVTSAYLNMGTPVLVGIPDSQSFWICGWSPISTVLAHADELTASGSGGIYTLLPAYGLSAATIPVFLLLAARRVAERPTNESQPFLQRVFRQLDRLFERAESRVFGRQSVRDLPRQAPVFWREVHRRSLANPRYLIRLFVVPGTLVLCFALFAPDTIYIIGLAASLLLAAIIGVGVIGAERSDQTLAVLLSSPLAARAVIRQKTRAMARLPMTASAILLLVSMIAQFSSAPSDSSDSGGRVIGNAWPFLAATAVVLPAMVFWLAVFMGLQLRGWVRPLFMSVITAGVWLLLPLVLAILLLMPWDWCVASDPLSVLVVPGPGSNETSAFKAVADASGLWWGLAAPTAAWLLLRWLSLRSSLSAESAGG